MDFRRNSYWAESISSIMKKTEVNLNRLQKPINNYLDRPSTSVVYPRNTDMGYDYQPRTKSAYDADDIQSSNKIDSSAIKSLVERLISDKLRHQKQAINMLSERVTALENHSESSHEKDYSQRPTSGSDSKFLSELKRVEKNYKNFITAEDLKISEETIKNTNIKLFGQLEADMRDLRNKNESSIEEIYNTIENKLKEIMKKNAINRDLDDLKSEIIQESENKIKRSQDKINVQFEDFSSSILKKQRDLEKKIEELYSNFASFQENHDSYVKEISKNMNNNRENILVSFESFQTDIKEKNANIFSKIDKDIENLKKYADNLSVKNKESLSEISEEIENVRQAISKDINKVKVDLEKFKTSSNENVENEVEQITRKIEEYRLAIKSINSSNLVSKIELNDAISNVTDKINQLRSANSQKQDSKMFATKLELEAAISEIKENAARSPQKKIQNPNQDFSNFVTKEELAESIQLLESKKNIEPLIENPNFVTKNELNQVKLDLQKEIKSQDNKNYITREEFVEIEEAIKSQEIDSSKYATKEDLSEIQEELDEFDITRHATKEELYEIKKNIIQSQSQSLDKVNKQYNEFSSSMKQEISNLEKKINEMKEGIDLDIASKLQKKIDELQNEEPKSQAHDLSNFATKDELNAVNNDIQGKLVDGLKGIDSRLDNYAIKKEIDEIIAEIQQKQENNKLPPLDLSNYVTREELQKSMSEHEERKIVKEEAPSQQFYLDSDKYISKEEFEEKIVTNDSKNAQKYATKEELHQAKLELERSINTANFEPSLPQMDLENYASKEDINEIKEEFEEKIAENRNHCNKIDQALLNYNTKQEINAIKSEIENKMLEISNSAYLKKNEQDIDNKKFEDFKQEIIIILEKDLESLKQELRQEISEQMKTVDISAFVKQEELILFKAEIEKEHAIELDTIKTQSYFNSFVAKKEFDEKKFEIISSIQENLQIYAEKKDIENFLTKDNINIIIDEKLKEILNKLINIEGSVEEQAQLFENRISRLESNKGNYIAEEEYFKPVKQPIPVHHEPPKEKEPVVVSQLIEFETPSPIINIEAEIPVIDQPIFNVKLARPSQDDILIIGSEEKFTQSQPKIFQNRSPNEKSQKSEIYVMSEDEIDFNLSPEGLGGTGNVKQSEEDESSYDSYPSDSSKEFYPSNRSGDEKIKDEDFPEVEIIDFSMNKFSSIDDIDLPGISSPTENKKIETTPNDPNLSNRSNFLNKFAVLLSTKFIEGEVEKTFEIAESVVRRNKGKKV
ncbi:unnamed protein product [Blepharisma stoltei]|uniref:Uncharacterized protein n=1 Tax=Blepharisma stoltei TaxID=1481888 RepID=A0AAU9J020_9CILI|nr:unnamed protein product [Blepharisma stoltei]